MNNKILAATYNMVASAKMLTVMIDVPMVLIPKLLQHKELTITYKDIKDITIEEILNNPFVPVWTKQQKSMSEELVKDVEDIEDNNSIWLSNIQKSNFSYDFPNRLIDIYQDLINKGVHKQNANNLLFPFAYTTCIISGTEWDSFFELRCPKYQCIDGEIYKSKKEWWFFAKLYHGSGSENIQEPDWQFINKSITQPELQTIAETLYDLYQEAKWKKGEYHIPFESEANKLLIGKYRLLTDETNSWEKHELPIWIDCESGEEVDINEIKMLISASMCNNLSYNTLEKHLERAASLQEPFNHQAIAMDAELFINFTKTKIEDTNYILPITEHGWCDNLRGFISYQYLC